MAIYPNSGSTDKEVSIFCITEASIETLLIDQSKKEIVRIKKVNLPVKVLNTKQSEQKLNESNILILTINRNVQDKEEVCLWTCSPNLKFSLLLKDDSEKLLDRNSYFDLLKIQNHILNPEPQKANQLYLVCISGGNKRQLSLHKINEPKTEYEMS